MESSQPVREARLATRRRVLTMAAALLGISFALAPAARAQVGRGPCGSSTSATTLCAQWCAHAPSTTSPASAQPDPDRFELEPCVTQPRAQLAPGARTVELRIYSEALRRRVGVRVMLPPNFYTAPEGTRWPVLYLLHGADLNGLPKWEYNYALWTDRTDIESTTYDANVVIVMPEGGDIGFYSDWLSQPPDLLQRWETFHFDELGPVVEERFRAGAPRAIAGLSMGGMGAASYAARFPGTFDAVATFSGALATRDYAYIVQGGLIAKGYDPNAVWGGPTSAAWSEHDPKQRVSDLVDLPVWVHAGDGTGATASLDALEVAAWYASNAFANALSQAIAAHGGAGHVVRDLGCKGRHRWEWWDLALKRAWPFLKAHLVGGPQPMVAPPCP